MTYVVLWNQTTSKNSINIWISYAILSSLQEKKNMKVSVFQPPRKFENFTETTSTLAQAGGFAQKPFLSSIVKICQCLGVAKRHQNFGNLKKMFFLFWIFLGL